MSDKRERVSALKGRADELEVELLALRGQLASQREDLDRSSDALINSLQELRGTEARVAAERARLRDAAPPGSSGSGVGTGSGTGARRPASQTTREASADSASASLERLLAAGRGTAGPVQKLGRLAASMHSVADQLGKPGLASRSFALDDESDGGSLEDREGSGLISPSQLQSQTSHRERDSVDVVLDHDGDRAQVTVRLSPGQTLQGVLDYVADYWGLAADDHALFDAHGQCWPLYARVSESLADADAAVLYLRFNAAHHASHRRLLATTSTEDEDAAAAPAAADAEDSLERDGSQAAGQTQTQTQTQPAQSQARADGGSGGGGGGEGEGEGEGGSSKLMADMHRLGLERRFERGYRFSLVVLRHHCESFLFLLLLTLVFVFSLFGDGAYDSQPLRQAVEDALLGSPFDVCPACAAGSALPAAITFHSVDSVNALFAFLDGPVRELLTLPSASSNASSSFSDFDVDVDVDVDGEAGGDGEAEAEEAPRRYNYSATPVVQQYSVLVGKVQLQQLRVESRCDDTPSFAGDFAGCFPPLQDSAPSTAAYSVGVDGALDTLLAALDLDLDADSNLVNLFSLANLDLGDNGTLGAGVLAEVAGAFRFSQSAQNANLWPGFVSDVVSGVGDRFHVNEGGFSLELSMERDVFSAQLAALAALDWVDVQTRAVVLNANLYNANSDLFAVVGVVFQFTVSNAVIPSFFLVPTRVSRWGDNESIEDGMKWAALLVYGLLVLALVGDFAASRDKPAFLRRPRALVDLLLLGLVVVAVGFKATWDSEKDNAVALLESRVGVVDAGFVDLRGLAFGQSVLRTFQGCITVMLALKGVMYLRLNPSVSFVGSAFDSTLGMVNQFVVVLAVVVLAFAVVGHFIFGRIELYFYQFDLSLFTVLGTMLGVFKPSAFGPLAAASAYQVLFSYVVFFLGYFGLLRVFFAIIAQGFSAAMDKVRQKGFFWLPDVNQTYKVHSQHERALLRKAAPATSKFGLPLQDTSALS